VSSKTDWAMETNENGEEVKGRTVKSTFISAFFKVNISLKQVITKHVPDQMYIIDTESLSSGVPYADYSTVHTRYIITSNGPSSSHFTMKVTLKFTRKMMSFVKSTFQLDLN
jgi:hypothetical protein